MKREEVANGLRSRERERETAAGLRGFLDNDSGSVKSRRSQKTRKRGREVECFNEAISREDAVLGPLILLLRVVHLLRSSLNTEISLIGKDSGVNGETKERANLTTRLLSFPSYLCSLQASALRTVSEFPFSSTTGSEAQLTRRMTEQSSRIQRSEHLFTFRIQN